MFPPDFLSPTLAYAVATAIAAGLLRGFAGFGSGMVLVPVYSLLYGPASAIAICMLMEMFGTLQLLPKAVRNCDWRQILPMSVCVIVAIPVGTWLLLRLDPVLVLRGIGVVVLGFVAVMAAGWRYRGPRGLLPSSLVGLVSGVGVGLSGIGGPPVIFYFLSGPDPVERSRANIIVFLAVVGVGVVLSLWWNGLITVSLLARAVVLTVPFMLTGMLGARLFDPANEKLYRRAALVLLALVGTSALAL